MYGDWCANMRWYSQLDGMGYFGSRVVASMLWLVNLPSLPKIIGVCSHLM